MKNLMMFVVIVMFLTLGMVRQSTIGTTAQVIQKVNSSANAAAHSVVDTTAQKMNTTGPAKWVANDAATLASSTYNNPALGVNSKISSVSQNPSTKAVTLTIKSVSTGKVQWSKQYQVTLTPAYVTNLASVKDGRAVFDRLTDTQTGTYQVIAMWVPGDLKPYQAGRR